jgi:hypothetical protein
MQDLLPQFLFRVLCGIAVALFVIPSKYTDRASMRLVLWGVTVVAAVAAAVLFLRRDEYSNADQLGWMSLIVSATALGGTQFMRREQPQWTSSVMGLLSLLGLIFALIVTPWSPETSPPALVLGVIDLASCVLILGVTMCAVALCFWHLNTPKMQTVPLGMLIVLMASAAVGRTGLCLVGLGLAVVATGSPGLLLGVFLFSRWLMAVLGLAMLVAMRRAQGRTPESQGSMGLLFAGLTAVAAGELGAQLVSVHLLYSL